MSEALINALNSLNVNDDNHWTADGLPRLDILKTLTGGVVLREEINQVKPGFSRTTANEPTPSPAPKAETPEPTATETNVATEDSLDAQINKAKEELAGAQEEAAKASKIALERSDALDKLIDRKAKTQKTDLANDIKKFQESQAKQREANAAITADVAKLVKERVNA